MTNHLFYCFASSLIERHKFLTDFPNPSTLNRQLKQWRQRKTLVTDKEFQLFLTSTNQTKTSFAQGLTPLSENNCSCLLAHLEEQPWLRFHRQLFKRYPFQQKTKFLFDSILTVQSNPTKKILIKQTNLSFNKPLFTYFLFHFLKNELSNFTNLTYPIVNSYELIKKQKSLLDLDIVLTYHLDYYKNQLHKLAEKFSNITVLPQAISQLVQQLRLELMQLAGKTLIWDVHNSIDRFAIENQKKATAFQNYLTERFSTAKKTYTFFTEYPTLAKLLSIRTIYALNQWENFLSALFQTENELLNCFHIYSPLVLSKISTAQGDTHQQGASVIEFVLNNNSLLYKPKNLKISNAFDQLTTWIKSLDESVGFYSIKRITTECFTIEEKIIHETCTSIEEICQFYQNYGYLVALSYWLGSSDLHLDNPIAHRQWPVIIDGETLLSSGKSVQDSMTKQQDTKAFSIADSGLLPIKKRFNMDVELSALVHKTQYSTKKLPQLAHKQTTDIRLVWETAKIAMSKNGPLLNGEKINYLDYTQNIITGFNQLNHLLLANKNKFIRKIKHLFNQVPIRVILRHTQTYGDLLEHLKHPSCSVNFIEREKIVESLWHNNLHPSVILAESQQLLEQDIPFFYTYSNNLDLYSQNTCIKNYFINTPLESLTQRIKTIDKMACDCILVELMTILQPIQLQPVAIQINSIYKQDTVFVNKALAISKVLLDNSHLTQRNDGLIFPDLAPDETGRLELVYPDNNLYNGSAGIYIFLTTLIYQLNNSDRYQILDARFNAYLTALKHELFEQKLTLLDFPPTDSLSAFYGIGANLTAALTSYSHTKQKYYYDFIQSQLDYLFAQPIIPPKTIEWLNGLSSFLVLLGEIYRYFPAENLKEYIYKQLNFIQPFSKNISLPNNGFAHGYSGILYSLKRLKDQFNDLTINALISKLEQKCKNDAQLTPPTTTAWCNGQFGLTTVGISAPTSLKTTTFTDNQLKDSCLCHGQLSNLLLLQQETPEQLNIHLNKWANSPFYLQSVHSIIPLGFWNGLSGIGYYLLYFSQKNKLPNLALLQF